MEFRIADTFTDSLSKLSGDEQKAVKQTAFDLQLNTANPGMNFHRVDKAKDKNFWSVRVSSDLRLILHRNETSLLLCYVDHHDNAYRWAERRKLEVHPKTGAAQFVEIRERVEEIIIPKYIEVDQPKPPKPMLFAHLSKNDLLDYGIPTEWLDDVLKCNEDSILELANHLPAEAAEALLELATGGKPQILPPISKTSDPFTHPDAQRRFRLMENPEELERALDSPWEKWIIFLHPAQRQLVEKDFSGPARVSGSAGTGKTIVALHRAVFLTRKNPDTRILLTTFSDTLANMLRTKLRRLISNDPKIGERLEIHSMDAIGQRLYELHLGKANLGSQEFIRNFLKEAATKINNNKFSLQFLETEWDQIVDAWQLKSWEEYRDVKRLGRKTRLPEPQRQILWKIFEQVFLKLKDHNLLTRAEMFTRLTLKLENSKNPPFDFIVVDEAQDINVPQLKFLSTLAKRQNGLFFAGDLGQRIFQQAFSWKALGVDIRGRSRNLYINYRTSHQIRMQADHLLGPEISDVDGNLENRHGTISVFNGPPPIVQIYQTVDKEIISISEWLCELTKANIKPHEIAVFVRSEEEIGRAIRVFQLTKIPYKKIDQHVETTNGFASICTMHLAKGLEFRAVAVMACDDEILPQQKRIESVTDESDLEEVYQTERNLLYVACTRARDHLLVTGVSPASEFLDDLLGNYKNIK